MITYKQLVEKTMPPEKKRSASRCVVGHYLVRPISNIISIPLIEMGVNPTPVTIVSLIPILLAMVCFIFSKTITGFIVGWLLILLWNILDGVDGNIARYCNKTSKTGEMWDATVGWIAVIVFYEGIGFATYRLGENHFIEPAYYLFLGGMTAILWLFPRLVMHKKTSVMGSSESSHTLKDLNHEKKNIKDIAKLFFFNCISINGGAAIIFLVSMLTGVLEVCMWFYFLLNGLVALGSLWALLK